MAITVVDTKSAATMRLIKDADTIVNSTIPGVAVNAPNDKLWTVARALNDCQAYNMSKVRRTNTVEIDES